MDSVTFSVPLPDTGGVATGASHAEASRSAAFISASHGFEGTENHGSLDAFVGVPACASSGIVAATASDDDSSRSFTFGISSTAPPVLLGSFSREAGVLAAAPASPTATVVDIVPLSSVASGMLAGARGVSNINLLAVDAFSTSSGFSSTRAQDSP